MAALLTGVQHWISRKPRWALTIAVLLALGPFLAKPFNMDDPLFVWSGKQIQCHPDDPYGFVVNWEDTARPMWVVTANPPLACYYLALSAGILGWSETALHLAFLLPAAAAILGTYRLARRFCGQPLLAACATLFTPVFLVSSTSLMCDTMMLAFWVWAVALWVEGIEEDRHWRLGAAALLMAFAAVTKYFGACLIPLLFVYGLAARRRFGFWTAYLLIPVAVLAAYQGVTLVLYGRNLLYGAGDYARQARAWYGFPAICTVLVSLAFTGGCAAVAAFFSPLLWRARYLAIATACMLLVVWFARGAVFKMYRTVEGSSVFLLIQMALWALGGLSVLGLALADVCSRRDARSWLLALWVLGTFSFTAFVNWIVNGRSILPMIPAVAILLARRLEQRGRTSQNQWRTGIGVALAASALLAVLVTQADFLYAMAVRRTVKEVRTEYASEENTMWFLGHWGFEYYMEAAGARAADARCGLVKPGDFVAVPARNPTFISMDPATLAPLGQCAAYGPRWLATMNDATGAGFYASFWGPLPFAFGRVPPEVVTVNVVTWPNVPPGQ